MRCPRAESALTRWVSACVVHLSRLIGSPLGESNSSRSPCKVGSVSVAFFLPPPACWILPCALSRSPFSSLTPRCTVFQSAPESAATWLMPPEPILSASVPRYKRHCCSFNSWRKIAYCCCVVMPGFYHISPPFGSYLRMSPKGIQSVFQEEAAGDSVGCSRCRCPRPPSAEPAAAGRRSPSACGLRGWGRLDLASGSRTLSRGGEDRRRLAYT